MRPILPRDLSLASMLGAFHSNKKPRRVSQVSPRPSVPGRSHHKTRQSVVLRAFADDPKRHWLADDVAVLLRKEGFETNHGKTIKLLEAMAVDLKIDKIRGCGRVKQPKWYHREPKVSNIDFGDSARLPSGTLRRRIA